METEIGCGVAEHSSACLCDVKIINPLPPLADCIRDGVADLFMGSRVCEIQGYGVPWNRLSMLDYFTDMVEYWDALHAEQELYAVVDTDVVIDATEPTFTRWGKTREAIQSCMDKKGVTLSGVIRHLGLDCQEAMNALTANRGSKEWTFERIDELERLMKLGVSRKVIAQKLDIPFGNVRGLAHLFKSKEKDTAKAKARVLLNELCMNPDYNAATIMEIIVTETGVQYTPSAITKRRTRTMG
jgi:hypothetical protein